MKAKKENPQEIDVKEIPGLSEIYGKKQSDTDLFEPTSFFDELGIPEEYRYTFKLKCLSDGDKSKLLGFVKRAQMDAVLWCKKNNVNISGATEETLKGKTVEEINSFAIDNILMSKKCQEATPRYENYKVIQKYVVGLTKYRTPELKPYKFTKETKQVDYISNNMWATIPTRVKELLYSRLLEISNVTEWETINL